MNRYRYAPKMAQKPVNKRPARILTFLGVLLLIMEIILVVPGMWRGIFLVRFWIYVLTGGLAVLCLLASFIVRAFQARKYELTMKVVAIMLISVFFMVAYITGAWVYNNIQTGGVGEGVFDSPDGRYGVYVCRFAEYDAEGNELSAVYRGYRCFDREVYLYEELDVPAGDGFTVEWPDGETAVLSSGGESVTISFKAQE